MFCQHRTGVHTVSFSSSTILSGYKIESPFVMMWIDFAYYSHGFGQFKIADKSKGYPNDLRLQKPTPNKIAILITCSCLCRQE